MIAKISTGSYTFGMVNYNHNKTKKETKGEKRSDFACNKKYNSG